jgi:hypothetical protein
MAARGALAPFAGLTLSPEDLAEPEAALVAWKAEATRLAS